jgi:hypothetical protein
MRWGLWSWMLVVCGGGLVVANGQRAHGADPVDEVAGMQRLAVFDFEDGATTQWDFTDAGAWKIETLAVGKGPGAEGTKVLELFRQSKYETPVRSPFNRAMVKDLVVGDFVLDVRLQSTKPDYPHRDLCLFFGYRDPSHFYYVHFGKVADPHANQIFVVDNAPRKAISLETTKGTPWTDAWHRARIVRRAESGTIDVFFDDLEKPAMRAVDKSFPTGLVGVGSFDDIGRFDELAIYGTRAP